MGLTPLFELFAGPLSFHLANYVQRFGWGCSREKSNPRLPRQTGVNRIIHTVFKGCTVFKVTKYMCYIILLYPEIRLKRAPQFHTVFKVIRVQAFRSQYLRCIGVGIDNRLTGHLKVYKVTVLCEENYGITLLQY